MITARNTYNVEGMKFPRKLNCGMNKLKKNLRKMGMSSCQELVKKPLRVLVKEMINQLIL